MNRDWRPDWRNENLYSSLSNLSLSQWAWEFLRRNPQYLKRWEELILPFWDDIKQSFDDDALDDSVLFTTSCPLELIQNEFGVRFLGFPSHPSNSRPVYLIGNKSTSRVCLVTSISESDKNLYGIKGAYQLLRVDLTVPIDEQLKIASKILKRKQIRLLNKSANVTRPKRFQFIKYVRILDAIDAGARPKDITQYLFQNLTNPEDNYKNFRKRALAMRDYDYRTLFLIKGS